MPDKRLLVVDDDRVIVELLKVNLELEGYDVVTAADGEDALRAVAQWAPDCVLLDIMMPRLDGHEVLRRLQSDPATAAVPVIFLSARAQDLEVRTGVEMGAAAYVTKPFDPADLIDTIERVLSGERPGAPPPA